MKLTKSLLALVLAFAMVGSLASVFAFAAFGYTATAATFEVDDNVFYTPYDITSGENGNTTSAHTLTFDPDDGYLPLVYAANAGWASKLETQFTRASLERWGYEPVAVLNGSFFSMADGTLVGITVTDGRVTCAHTGYSGEMITFDNTGKLKVVNSCLDYKLFVNGKELSNALYYFNKLGSSDHKANPTNKIYYWDSACGSVSDSAEFGKNGITGVEVVFNKVNNSELSIGGTLVGEVVSVYTDTKGGAAIGADQFVLYCRNESSYASVLSGLKAGNTVKITVNETIAASKETIENCFTAITNVGWLVKDGVDQTQTQSTIGTHSVTLDRGWTAIGTKPDGSIVFFTSKDGTAGSGTCITLRDVAKTMMDLGCNNVFRMDGGGSCAMYLADTGDGTAGYAQYSSRSVSDCILIVKKSSVAPTAEQKTALDVAIKTAEEAYKSEPGATIKTALDAAKAVKNDSNSTEGDYKSAIMAISAAVSGKQELKLAVTKAEAIKRTDYCQYVLDNIAAALKAAKAVLNNSKATDDDISAAYAELTYWYNLTGSQLISVSYGKDYTLSATPNATYPDTDGVELTDGKDGNGSEGFSPSWVGFNGKSSYDFIVDLGSSVSNMTKFSVNALQLQSWGIQLPKEVVVYVSNDKTNWTKAGTMTPESGILGATNKDGGYTLETTLSNGVSGRYVKFSVTPYATFIFIGEVSAYAKYDTVTEVVTPPDTDTSEPETSTPEIPEVDVSEIPEDATVLQQVPFNTAITAGSTTIVTDLTILNDLNPVWAANALLRPTDKEGVYEVIEVIEGSGSAIEFTAETKEGDIVLVVHGDDQSEDTTSMDNRAALLALTAGDTVTVLGYSIENQVLAENAVIYYGAKTDDETSDIPDETSDVDDSSVPEESSEPDESSKADESVADTSEGEDDKSGNTGLIIGIVVAVVAIAAVVAVVVVLKKKKA